MRGDAQDPALRSHSLGLNPDSSKLLTLDELLNSFSSAFLVVSGEIMVPSSREGLKRLIKVKILRTVLGTNKHLMNVNFSCRDLCLNSKLPLPLGLSSLGRGQAVGVSLRAAEVAPAEQLGKQWASWDGASAWQSQEELASTWGSQSP